MLHSLPKNQPVTKTKINAVTRNSNVKTATNPFFDIIDDEEEEDFLTAPLDDIDFDELDFDDEKDFKYDDEEDDLYDDMDDEIDEEE